MEFSKKIVLWGMVLTTTYMAVALFFFYTKGNISSELTDLIVIIVTGVIISYAGKSGVENYQKIKRAKCEEGETK